MRVMPAVAQIELQRLLIPRYWRRRRLVESIGRPAFGLAAGEVLALFLGAQGIARRVTRAAMAEALGQIGTMVPGLAFRCIRLIRSLLEEQKLPSGDGDAQIERKW